MLLTVPTPDMTVFNLFIYQTIGGYPGPSRVSDSPVFAENVIYEAFVLFVGNWLVLPLLPSWRKGEVLEY